MLLFRIFLSILSTKWKDSSTLTPLALFSYIHIFGFKKYILCILFKTTSNIRWNRFFFPFWECHKFPKVFFLSKVFFSSRYQNDILSPIEEKNGENVPTFEFKYTDRPLIWLWFQHVSSQTNRGKHILKYFCTEKYIWVITLIPVCRFHQLNTWSMKKIFELILHCSHQQENNFLANFQKYWWS